MLAPNHLISSGVIGGGQCGARRTTTGRCTDFHRSTSVPTTTTPPPNRCRATRSTGCRCGSTSAPRSTSRSSSARPASGRSTSADARRPRRRDPGQAAPAGPGRRRGLARLGLDQGRLDARQLRHRAGDPMLAVLSGFGDYEHAAGTLTFSPGRDREGGDREGARGHPRRARRDVPRRSSRTRRAPRSRRLPAWARSSTTTGRRRCSVGDVSVLEGDSGTTAATFEVSSRPASGRTMTVDFATAGVTATSGVDFQAPPERSHSRRARSGRWSRCSSTATRPSSRMRTSRSC